MRAYKGFNKNEDGTLVCRDMVYEPGKTYRYDGEIELCHSGFHACHELWQVWPFYPNNGQTAYYEVECGGKIIEDDEDDGKFVCSEITIIKEVDVSKIAKFDDIYLFREGFAWVRVNDKHNFINTDGKLLSEQWFDGAWSFSEGFAWVRLNDKWNFIGTNGKPLSEKWFDGAWNFLEGLAMVEIEDKYNFVNTEGKLLSEQWFDDADNFSEGFARVKLNGKGYNYIGTNGKLLSNKWFDYACVFCNGFAQVKLNGTWMKINKNGNLSEI